MVKWSDEPNSGRNEPRQARNDNGPAKSLFNVVPNDAGTSSSSGSAQQSEAQENSGTEEFGSSVSDHSRRVWDNGPSGVRRLEKTQGNLKTAVGLGNKIVVSFPYDKDLVTAVKNLIGRKWEPDGKRWICEPSADLERLLNEHMFVVDDFAKQILQQALPMNSVTQKDHVLILKVGYNPQLLEEIRSIASRKWDKNARHWTFSIVAIPMLAKLAQDYGLVWNVADENIDKPQVVLDKGWLSVAFSAERDVQEIMAELYGTKWDGYQMRWLVPIEYAPEIKMAVDEHGFTVDSEIEREFERFGHEIELLTLSKSQKATLEIPGMRIELMPFQQAGVLYVLKALNAQQQSDKSWVLGLTSSKDSND